MGARRARWFKLDSAAFALAILAGLLAVGGIWLVSSFENRRAYAIASAQQDALLAETRQRWFRTAYFLNVLQAQRAIESGRPDLARDPLVTARSLGGLVARRPPGGGSAAASQDPPAPPEFEWHWLDRKLKAPGSEILARGSELKGPAPEETAASLAFAPDGRSIALGLPDGRVVVRALPGADLRWEASGGKHPVVGVAFSHDGKLLAAVGREGGARILDAASGKDAFPPFALGQSDPRGPLFDEHGMIHFLGAPLISMKPGEPPRTTPSGEAAWAATGPDHPRFLLSDGTGQLRLAPFPIAPGAGDVLVHSGFTPLQCAVSSDGLRMVRARSAGGRHPLFLDEKLPDGNGTSSAPWSNITAVAFNPSGSRLALGGADGRASLANPTIEVAGNFGPAPAPGTAGGPSLLAGAAFSVEILALPPLADPGEGPAAIIGIAFSHDGNLLAAIDARGCWAVWDGSPRDQAGAGGPIRHPAALADEPAPM